MKPAIKTVALSLALLWVLTVGPLPAAPPQAPENHAALKRQMQEFEGALGAALRQMFEARPFVFLEEPKSIYLTGFGLVVHTELNLYPTSSLLNFMSAEALQKEMKAEREQKGVRLRQLEARLRELLLAQSGPLTQLSGDENMAVVVHLFNPRPFPEIPSQIIVQARRQALLELQVQGRKLGPEELAKVISLREF